MRPFTPLQHSRVRDRDVQSWHFKPPSMRLNYVFHHLWNRHVVIIMFFPSGGDMLVLATLDIAEIERIRA